MRYLLLLFLPLMASAQPPGYTCTHWNDYYLNGTPPPGSPNECEAIGPTAADGSFIYFFPLSQSLSDPLADPPAQAAPEVSPQGAVGALTLLCGAIAVGIGRRGKRATQERA